MQIEDSTAGDGITRLALVGKLDINGLHEVDLRFHALTAARAQPAIVDLSRLEFIGSLGMGMLISCAQSLQRKGKKLVLFGAQGAVDTALRTAGIDQAIPMATDAPEAVRLLSA